MRTDFLFGEPLPDFLGGDPANYVVGKPDEKPARRHAPQKPKPKVRPMQFEDRLLRDIRQRMASIAPALEELPRLEKAEKILKELKHGR